MSMKGSVSNTDVRLEMRGPTLLEAARPSYFAPRSPTTLTLNFEINITELQSNNSDEIHSLVMALSEEINRRLS